MRFKTFSGCLVGLGVGAMISVMACQGTDPAHAGSSGGGGTGPGSGGSGACTCEMPPATTVVETCQTDPAGRPVAVHAYPGETADELRQKVTTFAFLPEPSLFDPPDGTDSASVRAYFGDGQVSVRCDQGAGTQTLFNTVQFMHL